MLSAVLEMESEHGHPMSSESPLSPLSQLDLAHAEAPDLHELIDSSRSHGPVVPVRFHGGPAWLVTGYEEVRAAFDDEVNFTSAAFYSEHAEPSMGRTMQVMVGDEHRVNRSLV